MSYEQIFNKPLPSDEKVTDRELKRNGEGYIDPTAYEAIKRAEAEAEHEKIRKLIGCLHRVCELSGYTIENRVILRDNKTGKVWG